MESNSMDLVLGGIALLIVLSGMWMLLNGIKDMGDKL